EVGVGDRGAHVAARSRRRDFAEGPGLPAEDAGPGDEGDCRQGDEAAADEPVAVHAEGRRDGGETRGAGPQAVAGLTRGERNIAWIEEYCRTPEGRFVGMPIELRDWQKAELRKIYDNPHGTRQAIISLPRKNGKTALIAFLLLLHLCGPEAKPNSQLYSAAQSRDQAATVFKLAAKVIRMSPDLSPVVIIRDTAKELLCPELGTFYAALSADKSTAHGKSPVFAVHDELGQVK